MPRKETVKRVIDGDTFETTHKGRKRSVRLANVDAPEKGIKGGAKATKALKDLIQGKEVVIDTVAKDVYGRAVAKVKVGRKSVNNAVKAATKKKPAAKKPAAKKVKPSAKKPTVKKAAPKRKSATRKPAKRR